MINHLSKKYTVVNSCILEDSKAIEGLVNILHRTFEGSVRDNHSTTYFRLRNEDIVGVYNKNPHSIYGKVLTLKVLLDDRGLKFILLQGNIRKFPFLILFTRGRYEITAIYTINELNSDLNKIDNISSHVYHMNILINDISASLLNKSK